MATEVERFLHRLGVPQSVVDIFVREECHDLESFMYLRPEDLEELAQKEYANGDSNDTAGGSSSLFEQVDQDTWMHASRAIERGVDEMNAIVDHSWETDVDEEGETYHYNRITGLSCREKPEINEKRRPKYDIDWDESMYMAGGYTYFDQAADQADAEAEQAEAATHAPAEEAYLFVDYEDESDMKHPEAVYAVNGYGESAGHYSEDEAQLFPNESWD